MTRTIIVCGHGPGISDAVARRFGREGFNVAIVARSAERLSRAAAALAETGITAKAFPCDLGDPDAVRAMVQEVKGSLGPVAVLHWNAYHGAAGDLVAAPTSELRTVFDVAVTGMVAAVQAALPDLKSAKGAVLVTGGGFAFYDPNVDAMGVQFGAMGLSIAKAAQHKAVGLLKLRLADEGVFVGEVMVLGMVKGTAFDAGNATLDASTIAEKFWELQRDRAQASISVS
jgi:NAD(P)-dependent dehydrogenase (short-subunit alcohol dehydrogenase family)